MGLKVFDDFPLQSLVWKNIGCSQFIVNAANEWTAGFSSHLLDVFEYYAVFEYMVTVLVPVWISDGFFGNGIDWGCKSGNRTG